MKCPTQLELECAAAGRADADLARRVGEHAAQCATCSSRIEEHGERALLGDLRRALSSAVLTAAPVPELPSALSRYRVLRLIGRGGMGAVYEAEQLQPRRRVALKVLESGSLDPRAVRRFEFESEVLARLDHAAIARVHDAGTYREDGRERPFFAMELVDGTTLSRWIEEARPDLRRRLELFAAICDGVQHAHQKGVVHRDLKPANILVTRAGDPKVLDFGVARATDADVHRTTLATADSAWIGTLPYMSPEQAAGDSRSVDARADVYALGVILYELAADRLPLEVADLPPPQALRRIVEDTPPELGRVRRELAGDLEVIAAKALEKHPALRYGSAAEMAADVRRFLADEPIAARRPSAWQQARRFARRHRAAVIAGTAVLGALVAGLVSTWVQARRAARAEAATAGQRDEAVRRALDAEATLGFLTDMLASVDADVGARGPSFTVRQALDEAGVRLATDRVLEPAARTALHVTLGNAYRSLGEVERADEHLGAALEARRAARPPDPLGLAGALNALAILRHAEHRFDDAAALAEESLELFRRNAGEDDPRTANSMTSLATIRFSAGDLVAAEPLYLRALEVRRARLGDAHPHVANSLEHIASLRRRQGRLDDAEALYREALGAHIAANGEGHPSVAGCRINLGLLLHETKRPAEAEPHYREAIEVIETFVGPEQLELLEPLYGLAVLESARGETGAAEQHFLRALAVADASGLGDSDSAYECRRSLAALLIARGDPAGAVPLLRGSQETMERRHGLDSAEVDAAASVLGTLLLYLGSYEDAVAHFRRTLETIGDARRRLPFEQNLGAALCELGELEESARVLRGVVDAREQFSDELALASARYNLSSALSALGEHEEAEQLARAALGAFEKELGPRHSEVVVARRNLAEVLERRGVFDGALGEYEQALALARELFPAGHARLGEVLASYGRCLAVAGRTEAASEQLEQGLRVLTSAYGAAHPSTLRCAAELERAHR